jgi:hypothetical protein
MPFLIGLLLALFFLLYATFRLWREPRYRLYLAMLLILDVWVGGVLGYLLFAAFFDL